MNLMNGLLIVWVALGMKHRKVEMVQQNLSYSTSGTKHMKFFKATYFCGFWKKNTSLCELNSILMPN